MSLIGTAHYPSVRAALDLTMTEADIPDSVIGLDIFQGKAEAVIIARYPKAETAIDAARLSVQRAAVFLTAANLARSWHGISEEQIDDLRVRYEKVDWDARAGELEAQAESELGELAPDSTATSYASRTWNPFGLASGTRGL